jgi:acylglycerol lipase
VTAIDTPTAASEGTFPGGRGREIFWQVWAGPGEPRAVVVLVHGYGEHSGRYAHVGQRLRAAGYAAYALDHHGHGRSAGERARITLSEAVSDLHRFVEIIGERHTGCPVFMLGHSMGGALALRYAMAYGDTLSGLIISSPLAIVHGRPAAKALGRRLGSVLPGLPVAKLDPADISRDPAVVAAYRSDPLVRHGGIPALTAAEFLAHADSLPADVTRVTVPTLLLYATADRLCDPEGARMIAERIGASDLTVIPYEGLFHEILNEPERDRVLDDVLAWLAPRVPATPPVPGES